MKNLIKDIFVYIISVIIGMILLGILMRLNLFEETTKVFYYRTLYSAVLATAIIGIFLSAIGLKLKRKNVKVINITPSLIFSSSLFVGIALFLFVTIGPLTIDRSYTIFSLADMTENSQKMFSREEIENRFSYIYIYQYNSIEKRIDEQLSIGNIEEVDGKYRISEKGQKLINVFRLVEKIYPVEDKRIIYPEYNDAKSEELK